MEKYIPTQAEVDSAANKFETIKEDTEWVTGPEFDIKAIGFEREVINPVPYISHCEAQLIYQFQVPLYLFGIPEGSNRSTAEEQTPAFQLRIRSIQSIIESVLTKGLFDPYIQDLYKGAYTDFEWGRRSPEEKEEELRRLSQLLRLPPGGITDDTRRKLEAQARELLDIEGEVPDEPYNSLPRGLFGGPSQSSPKKKNQKEEDLVRNEESWSS